MKITVIVIGKEKDFSAHDLVAEYSARIGHYLPIEWTYIPASDGTEEGKRILKAVDSLGSGTHVVALDEKGKEFTSTEFAKFTQTRMNEGLKSLAFIVGGSYGLNDEVRSHAQSTIALSKLTFPHQLVRLILAEQIYRACTIMKGEKYHH
ncbi:MAG: hypothetical protein RLY66_116 [Candidatus Parcubacteria bacterium]|jgi:23S rRNA (pseudouridine1915-N3)-methyltransferase